MSIFTEQVNGEIAKGSEPQDAKKAAVSSCNHLGNTRRLALNFYCSVFGSSYTFNIQYEVKWKSFNVSKPVMIVTKVVVFPLNIVSLFKNLMLFHRVTHVSFTDSKIIRSTMIIKDEK